MLDVCDQRCPCFPEKENSTNLPFLSGNKDPFRRDRNWLPQPLLFRVLK